jgi:hypothetical protein
MAHSFRWQPGQCIPVLMILTLVAEAGARFLPLASVSNRGTWEAVLRYSTANDVAIGGPGQRPGLAGRIERTIDPKDPRQGSFEINLHVENRRAYGTLASVGNVPAYRQYHVEDFTSDEFGFRNPPQQSGNRAPDALILGTSYIAQPGVIDEETLPEQLAARSGLRVSNGGTSGGDPEVFSDFLGFIRRAARRLGMTRGLVILDYKSGEMDFVIPREMPNSAGSAPLPMAAGPVADATRPWAAGVRRWLVLSRLKILAQRAYKSLQDDWFLPNIYAKKLLYGRLPHGETMLFFPYVTKPRPESAIEIGVKYCKWLGAQLARDGLTLVVLFVPRPVAVYGDLVTPPLPAEAWVRHYGALQAGLEAEGIKVVNPIEALRREARARLDRGDYLYYLDDTHWNAQGIAVTVHEILRVLPPAGWSASPAQVLETKTGWANATRSGSAEQQSGP